MTEKTFKWLHLSDLHAGLGEQAWMWPGMKHQFFEDLKKLHLLSGPWDAIIFTGDLTQTGSPEQFKALTKILVEIWKELNSLGSSPLFVCIPGNHDLVRPHASSGSAIALRHWWNDELVRKAFWGEPEGELRKCINGAFENFLAWRDSLPEFGIAIPNYVSGTLPGDFSTSIEFNGGSIGIVGLNSAWLQVDGGDYEGRLSIDSRQLLSVTDNDPVAWLRRHSASLLLTHHPVSWLHPEAMAQWNEEIRPPGRFDLHLFGHMHVPDAESISKGGAQPKHSIQAASIFGLERVNDTIERQHGYSAARIAISSAREAEIWPRELRKTASKARTIVPDYSFALNETTSSFKISLESAAPSTEEKASLAPTTVQARPEIGQSSEVRDATLAKVRYFVPKTPASVNVRRVEQRVLAEALNERARTAWISREWGAGSDGFIWAVQKHTGTEALPVFRIDCDDYRSREDFLSAIKSRLDFSFENFCEAASEIGPAYLILDDVPTSGQDVAPGSIPIEVDIEEMVAIIVQYCQNIRVLIRTRQRPHHASLPVVFLKMLDEADTRTYINDHPNGGDEFSGYEAVATIFRHTDGVPARIDSALRDLEFITIDKLAEGNLDLKVGSSVSSDVPRAIAKAIAELTSSEDPIRSRSFDLLKALSAFPQGESIDRLKRFYGAHPLHIMHARELLENSLVTTVAPVMVQGPAETGASRLLVVPRPVRDYVRSLVPREDLADVSKKAAALYFGDEWKLGKIKAGALARFKSSAASNAELVNASTIVIRLLNDAIEIDDDRGVRASLDLASSYASAMKSGSHFRNIAGLCRDILGLTPEEHEEKVAFLKLIYGESLRMLDDRVEAKEILEGLIDDENLIGQKNSLYLTLSLIHQTLQEPDLAKDYAKRVIKGDKGGNYALQARSILLEVEADKPNREQELLKLEALCRRRGATVVANNIALDRASKSKGDPGVVEACVDAVLASAIKDKDFYNASRAIARRVRLKLTHNEAVSDSDKALLIDAYHFVLNERIIGLFNTTHEVLWDLFDSEGDTTNLFRLFRLSSLIWRLRGDEDREEQFKMRLAKHAKTVIIDSLRSLDREVAYYLVRAGSGGGD